MNIQKSETGTDSLLIRRIETYQYPDTNPLDLTEQELCQILGVTRKTLLKARLSGALPFVKRSSYFVSYDYHMVYQALERNVLKFRGLPKRVALYKMTQFLSEREDII